MVYRVTAHGEPDLAGDIGLAGGRVGYMMGYSGVQSELLDVISGYNYGNNHHTLEYIYIYHIFPGTKIKPLIHGTAPTRELPGASKWMSFLPTGCLINRRAALIFSQKRT